MGASARVRELNDRFRTAGPLGCSWFVSAGVAALGSGFLAAAVDATCNFADFTADNDPYGEHDFGAFEMDGQRVFWKIDYYDQTITAGSPDAADPSLTKRVLTIMLASEY